ncbi:MAG: hypothetical protein HY825_09535 [Acidobacteria bacterium]|nr:hypothetical protein [Acidobacteriota bacterium]
MLERGGTAIFGLLVTAWALTGLGAGLGVRTALGHLMFVTCLLLTIAATVWKPRRCLILWIGFLALSGVYMVFLLLSLHFG